MWNGKFELPDKLYSISDIQDYFKYVIKKPETVTDNLPIGIYINKIRIRVIFKIKMGYQLEVLTPETIKLTGETKSKIIKNKNGAINKRFPHIRRGGGSGKSGEMRTWEGEWLAKCGHPLGEKNIATIFVKFTQIIWQYNSACVQ